MRISRVLATIGLGALLSVRLFAQYPVDPMQLGYRVILVMPFHGKGTASDPKRPVLLPPPDQLQQLGIEGFSMETSDDGQNAIVELVFSDPSRAQALVSDKRVLKAFEKGKDSKASIEQEVQKFKKTYSLLKNPALQAATGTAAAATLGLTAVQP